MSYRDKLAKCPYYIEGHTENNVVKCECALSGSTICKIVFKNKGRANGYFEKYCCSNYTECEIAKINEKKFSAVLT